VLGERLDTLGLERSDVINTVPLAFRVGQGYAVLFRYGVAVLVGLSPVEEDETLRGLRPRIIGPLERLEDTLDLRYVSVDRIGDDLRLIARPPGRERF